MNNQCTYRTLADLEDWSPMSACNRIKAMEIALKDGPVPYPNYQFFPKTVPVKPRGGKFIRRIGYAKLSNYNLLP